MDRLLITGLDTVVGSNVALALSDRCDMLALYADCALESPAVRSAFWAPEDLTTLENQIDDWQPQWIVHCGPLSACGWDATDEKACEREPQVAANLAQIAGRLGARLTVIVGDSLFAPPRMFHDEESTAFAATVRATCSRSVERALACSDALVVRTHAYGWDWRDEAPTFAQRAYDVLAENGCGGIEADGRRYATPILATDLADLLWRAYEAGLAGVYHLAGAERTNPYRFVCELAAILGVDLPRGLAEGAQAPPTCHEETSLSSKRARRRLAVATPLLREGLHRFAQQAYNGWRDRWHRIGALEETRELAA